MCWNTKMFVRRRNPNCFLALILSLLLVAPALGKASRTAAAINKLPTAIKICAPAPGAVLTPAFLRAPA